MRPMRQNHLASLPPQTRWELGRWQGRYREVLRGCNVVILPDHDEPGDLHAKQVMKSLKGVAADIAVRVDLPGLTEKQDMVDWVAAGGTKAQLDELIANAELIGEDARRNGVMPESEDDDQPQYFLGNKDKVLDIPANYETALDKEEKWKGRFAYNQFSNTIEIDGNPITDYDRNLIASWMSHKFQFSGKSKYPGESWPLMWCRADAPLGSLTDYIDSLNNPTSEEELEQFWLLWSSRHPSHSVDRAYHAGGHDRTCKGARRLQPLCADSGR